MPGGHHNTRTCLGRHSIRVAEKHWVSRKGGEKERLGMVQKA